jgi:hypothetical protein
MKPDDMDMIGKDHVTYPGAVEKLNGGSYSAVPQKTVQF